MNAVGSGGTAAIERELIREGLAAICEEMAVSVRGCAKTWVLAVLALGVGSCYKDSSGGVIVVVGEPVGDAS